LIVDDSEMNRAILTDMLEQEYEIIEAGNGEEAVALIEQMSSTLSLILLDIVMPKMDGFGVLNAMNEHHWIEDIPVIMISAEQGSTAIDRAYQLGATDYINRPFSDSIVHHRVVNTILLNAKQKRLTSLVEEQVRENNKLSDMMIDILSHIVEFRNGESGLHVIHIRMLTELLLNHLVQITDRYSLNKAQIHLVALASAFHDIGKIAIPSSILNKPGRLTEEEFAIMKTHSTVGATILDKLEVHRDEPLVKIAYEICRWHHERYDGRGYPDGLKGEEIPLSAQVVALADVYDALTSERVYKKAFSHDTAIQMICNGESGSFSPLLLQCLNECSEQIRTLFLNSVTPTAEPDQVTLQALTDDVLRREQVAAPEQEQSLELLQRELHKQELLGSISQEIQFEYTSDPPLLTLSAFGARILGVPQVISDPFHSPLLTPILEQEGIKGLFQAIHKSPEHQVVEYICSLRLGNKPPRWCFFLCRSVYNTDTDGNILYHGVVGKLLDIHNVKTRLDALEQMVPPEALAALPDRSQAQIGFLPSE